MPGRPCSLITHIEWISWIPQSRYSYTIYGNILTTSWILLYSQLSETDVVSFLGFRFLEIKARIHHPIVRIPVEKRSIIPIQIITRPSEIGHAQIETEISTTNNRIRDASLGVSQPRWSFLGAKKKSTMSIFTTSICLFWRDVFCYNLQNRYEG